MNPIANTSALGTEQAAVVPVVLCGGSGTRLWPLSRESYPKQFLRLNADSSLLQRTLQRLDSISAMRPPFLVCNESSRFIVAEQLREIGLEGAAIILEPARRNTAPAIAAAAFHALSLGDDPLLLVLPSDHVIKDEAAFRAAIEIARPAAAGGDLVIFGIQPKSAETGYGYIRSRFAAGRQTQAVLGFVEKPDRQTAERYLQAGDYFWNSGMFLFRASRYVEELRRFEPEMADACRRAVERSRRDRDFIRLDEASYQASPDKSIDYAVMERTGGATMVPLDAGWSDIGSWSSVWDDAQKDDGSNAVQGDVVLHDCENCLVHGTSRLIAAVGLSDTTIVETADALLIIGNDRAQDAKKIVAELLRSNRPEAVEHRKVFRPWGAYEAIGAGVRFQVKRITVKPGARLSLQMHHHRAEHWVVVSGTAKVTKGDHEFLLNENQSTYIPLGVVHSLENPGKIPLEIIEIQSGAYLGEDDIVRLDDQYGRA